MYSVTKRCGITWAEQDNMRVGAYGALIDCVLEEIAEEKRQDRKQRGVYTFSEAAGFN